ncbi:MAG: carboxymuconolactone decarboxylase family protein [Deltaproteobacteria bacterium]|nr:carboxymuconolactone decarboxylase family protein [Deltaproteobacteria bacterium]
MARIPLVETTEQLSAEHHAVYDGIVKSRGAVRGVFPALLHVPSIAHHTAELGAYVRFEAKLDQRIKALAVSVTVRELECRHEWSAQVRNAERNGLSPATIKAIYQRKPPTEFPEEDAMIIRYAHELLRNHRVSEPTFSAVRDRLGVQSIVDLTATIGYYAMISCSLNAFDLVSDPEPKGFEL